MYLNPTLFNLLQSRFSDVHIANEGESLLGEYKYDPIRDRVVLEIEARGETYCVSCPYCHESRNRLYINHRYGVWDDISHSTNTHMVRCFNEECFKKDPTLFKDLHDKIFGLLNPEARRNISFIRGKQPMAQSAELKEVSWPGNVIPLNQLPPNHQAIRFLEFERGYDINQLVERHNLQYCDVSESRYGMAQHRIIIPIIQEEKMVGWQARYPGDVNWKLMRIPKYYTLPSMPKRLVLYNHDTAMQQPIVIVTEGPTSSWTVWPYGVAILGKQATIQQQRMLISKCKDKAVVILLDGDAQNDAIRLYKLLKPHIKNLIQIDLPIDKDPGSYRFYKKSLMDIILAKSISMNVTLPSFNF